MAIQQLASLYLEALNKHGLEGMVTDSGNIKFNFEGRRHLIILDEDDPPFITITSPWVYEICHESERNGIFHICNRLAAEQQYVKFFIGEQRVDVLIEQFRPEHTENAEFLTVCLTFLNRAIDFFLEQVELMKIGHQ